MSSSTNAHGRGDLAKCLYKQINGQVFKKVLLQQLGLRNFGFCDKFGHFDLKLLLSIHVAVHKYKTPAFLDFQSTT